METPKFVGKLSYEERDFESDFRNLSDSHEQIETITGFQHKAGKTLTADRVKFWEQRLNAKNCQMTHLADVDLIISASFARSMMPMDLPIPRGGRIAGWERA